MAVARRAQGLGWVRDLPDSRDFLYAAPARVLTALPARVDLRPQCPAVYDQGQIGSCTANAIAGAIHFDRMKAGEQPDFVPSRLFIYYNERAMEHHVRFDAGAQIRDGVKSVSKLGVCPEPEWAYDDTAPENEGDPFPPDARAAQRPSDGCYTDALKYTAISYHRLDHTVLDQLKGCLAEGYPFVFGFTVYSAWYRSDPRPAAIPLPAGGDSAIGGHAVMCVGYDDATQQFTIRNSWGAGAGEHGYYYMPYAYLTNPHLSSDFWTIRSIKD
jgi:C1A family cysteine protease